MLWGAAMLVVLGAVACVVCSDCELSGSLAGLLATRLAAVLMGSLPGRITGKKRITEWEYGKCLKISNTKKKKEYPKFIFSPHKWSKGK